MKKKVLNLMLLVSIMTALIIMLPLTVNAALAYSGTCGDNLTWTLDDEGTLTISGSGDMYDYYPPDRYTPWCPYSNFADINKVVIEGNVSRIGDYAFFGCKSLESIEIPERVRSIGTYAFAYCEKLSSINLPNDLVWIEETIFIGCSGLENIQISEENLYFASENGVLYDKEKNILIRYPGANQRESYIIPEGVTAIEESAFEEGVHLKNVSIPDSMVSIGIWAFDNCDLLETVILPKGVTDIGMYAFSFCDSISNFQVDEENPCFSSESGVLYDKEKTTLICYPYGKTDELYAVPDSVTCLGAGSYLKKVIIPTSVKIIEDNAFSCSEIYYEGTEEEWAEIEIDGWSGLNSSKLHYNSSLGEAFGLKNACVRAMLEDNTKCQVTMLSGIDGLNYSKVGFEVTYGGSSYRYETKTVYEYVSVLNANGERISVDASEFDEACSYIFAAALTLGEEYREGELIYIPYAVDMNGKKIYGKESKINPIFK